MTPRAQAAKAKINRFCTAKETINRMKRQLTEWEKVFMNHVSYLKGVNIQKIKKCLQVNGKHK